MYLLHQIACVAAAVLVYGGGLLALLLYDCAHRAYRKYELPWSCVCWCAMVWTFVSTVWLAHVGQGGAVWITDLVTLCVAYVALVLVGARSPERRLAERAHSMPEVRHLVEEMLSEKPVVYWCTRKPLTYAEWGNRVDRPLPDRDLEEFTRVEVGVEVTFADDDSRRAFVQECDGLGTASMRMGSHVPEMLVVPVTYTKPYFMTGEGFWFATLMSFSWLWRLWMIQKSLRRFKINIVKVITKRPAGEANAMAEKVTPGDNNV